MEPHVPERNVAAEAPRCLDGMPQLPAREMTEEDQQEGRGGTARSPSPHEVAGQSSRLRPAQVAATSLAAVTGAFLASRLGVYGTVAGAGVLSVMSTVGGELYLRSLDRTKEVARGVTRSTGQLRSARQKPGDSQGIGTARVDDTVLMATVTALDEVPQDSSTDGEIASIATSDSGAAGVPSDVRSEQPPAWRRIRWRLVAGGAAAAFVLGMIVVSAIELIGGGSLSGGTGTTIGEVASGRSSGSSRGDVDGPAGKNNNDPADKNDRDQAPSDDDPEPAPGGSESEEPGSEAPEPEDGSGQDPAPDPDPTEEATPSPSPTTEPSAPDPSPTQTPQPGTQEEPSTGTLEDPAEE